MAQFGAVRNGLLRARDDSYRLAKQVTEPRCGISVVDLNTGDTVHWVRIKGVVNELYDIAILKGVRRPMALGFKTDEIRRTLTMGKMPEAPASGSIH